MATQSIPAIENNNFYIIPSNRDCDPENRVLKYSYRTCFSDSGGKKEMEKQENKKPYGKQGNPYKRGDTWTYIYYIEDVKTGKRKQKRKGGFKTKKEAEVALKETEADIVKGLYVEDKKLTVEQYINHWFHEIHKPTLQQSTINGYQINIDNHIIPNIGDIPLNKLSRNDILKMYNKMIDDGLSPTTVKYVNSVLRKALKEAVYNDLIIKNPCEGIKLPKQKKYKATVLNQEQIKTLLKASIDSDVELEVLLALTLGLRRGEAIGIKFSDIDFDKKTVHIQRQVSTVHDKQTAKKTENKTVWGLKDLKTSDSNRVLYVPQTVIDSILRRKAIIERNKNKYKSDYIDYDLVCCKENGMYENPQSVYRRFKKLLKKCDLPDIRFHDLRHSCATALLDLDVPLKVISNMLGHSTISITADIYCDVIDKKKQTADVMQKAFFD